MPGRSRLDNPLRPGIPEGGFAPYDRYAAPLLPVGRGTDINKDHSYVKPQTAPYGPNADPSTAVKPGADLASDSVRQHFPPNNLYNGSLNRQKSLERRDMMPVPIDGPTTEVVRPIAQSNFQYPSVRWTAHAAPPINRYIREWAQRFGSTELPGFLHNDGSHFSMAQSHNNRGWVRTKDARPMARNSIVPRNVPTPLDDSIVNKGNISTLGTVFTSYKTGSYLP